MCLLSQSVFPAMPIYYISFNISKANSKTFCVCLRCRSKRFLFAASDYGFYTINKKNFVCMFFFHGFNLMY